MKREKMKYRDWEIHPKVYMAPAIKTKGKTLWKWMKTKHEGRVLYRRLWNFWVRAGVDADLRSDRFFREYENASDDTTTLLNDIGFPWRKAETEQEVWERIGMVWSWLKDNAQVNNEEYQGISSVDGEWPSILDYAAYFAAHRNLVWAACFSKAHLFATLLGRMVYPRYRFGIASAHHIENGAPPTATHVYVGVYVGDRWFYLDPTAVSIIDFPVYSNRRCIGVSSFDSVDYEHPYDFIPVPLSGFEKVPYIPS
jgi:hypothetical protein